MTNIWDNIITKDNTTPTPNVWDNVIKPVQQNDNSKPTISLSDPFTPIKTTTPQTTTEQKSSIRLPFATSQQEISTPLIPSPISSFAINIVGRLLEVIPKVGVQLLSNLKGYNEIAQGKIEQPINLDFGDLGKRLGFDSNKIQSSGSQFMHDFATRQEANPNDFYKNFAFSYIKIPLSQIMDAFVAGSVGTTVAKVGLSATLTDPLVNKAMGILGIDSNQLTPQGLKDAFIKTGEEMIAKDVGIQELNQLGGATNYLIKKLGNEGIDTLNTFGEMVQKTSRLFLEDISKTTKNLPVGLSIEDISKQLPAKIEEAGRLAEQIKQAGDIQKAQGIVDEITKATSLSMADNLLGQLKTMAEPLTQEAQKYKSAEEFVKGQPILHHFTPNKYENFDLSKTEASSIWFTDNPSINKETGLGSVQGGDGAKLNRMDRFIPPNAKIADINLTEKFRTDELINQGYIGAKFEQLDGSHWYEIWNPNKDLKTKSQLTKAFEEAEGGKGIIQTIKDKFKGVNMQSGKIAVPENEFEKQLAEKEIALELAKEALANNEARSLGKYTNKRTGELPEVLGGTKSIFGRKGDDIVTKKGFADSEQARSAYESYLKSKESVAVLKQEVASLRMNVKDQTLLKKDIESAKKFLDKVANKSDKELIEMSKARAKEKLEQIKKIAQERKELAHRNLRELEQAIYPEISPLIQETPMFRDKIIRESDIGYKGEFQSLDSMLTNTATNVKEKVGALDWIRTPDRVLKKIGMGHIVENLRKADENYMSELPQHINLIKEWDALISKEGNVKIFRYLDGRLDISKLEQNEKVVATEIKEYLEDWAYRLGLPEDNQISHYITHIFEKDFIKKEFDEELAKIIADKVPGSVYDPFLEKRLGKKGYIEDTWRALDAYAKRAVRKSNMDPVLEQIKRASVHLELSQLNFVKNYADRINLRPTSLDNYFDNTIKQLVGYKFGQRPTNAITRTLRHAIYRGALGLNFGSAVKNLTQGVNTFSKLGAKYTTVGYVKLLTQIGNTELKDNAIFGMDIIQDRTISAVHKLSQKTDDVLFSLFSLAEKINRGSAYYGAKAKAIAEGKTEEQAIEFAKKIVRDTQFSFRTIDTPVILQSDIAKTIAQFGTFSIKQTEFLTEMIANKEWMGLMRYIMASLGIVYGIGKIFNIEGKDFNPINYFTRFGIAPSLSLPIEILKASINMPDRFGHPRDTEKKLQDILNSGIIYIPAGIQAQKTFRGLQTYSNPKKKVPHNLPTLLKAATLGSKNLTPDKKTKTSTDNPFNQ